MHDIAHTGQIGNDHRQQWNYPEGLDLAPFLGAEMKIISSQARNI